VADIDTRLETTLEANIIQPVSSLSIERAGATMLKILFIVPLLIALLLSGLACRHVPPGNGDVHSSPSPSPSESKDSNRPDAVKQQPHIQVRLVGLTLGMSLDSVIAIKRKEYLRPIKKPGTCRYDFVEIKEMANLCHILSGPSIVIDESGRIVEVYSSRAYYFIPAIEFTRPDGTMGQLKWDARSEEIVKQLGEPQQRKLVYNKFEDWTFPRMGLVLSVSCSDHSLFAARLKKIDKE